MSGPGPRSAAESLSAPTPSATADDPSFDPEAASPGAEAAAVLGGSFSAIRSIVQNEDRLIQELQLRSHSAPSAGGKHTEDSRGPYRKGTPMVITTEAFASQGRYIVFWSGPSNTSWKFELRAATEQTKSGTILHYWRDRSRAAFFDEPSVTFTFQTGNIMPVRFRDVANKSESIFLPPGLLDYYDFFDLLNQPKILPDGRPNFVFIAYHSLLYPEILLRGFFTPSGLSITESAENPAGLSWSSTFKVRSTEPPFWSSAQLISSWNSASGATSSSVQEAQAVADTSVAGGPVTGQGPQG